MGQEGDGAPGGLAALLVVRGRDEQRGDEARQQQHHAHDRGRGQQQLPGVGHAAPRRAVRARVVAPVRLAAVDERHDGDARLEAAQAQRELREDEERARDHQREVALRGERGAPVREQRRVREHLPGPAPEDDEVQGQVGQGGRGGEADRLLEALQEDRGEHGEDRERDQDLVVAEDAGEERVLDRVLGGVGGRQRHRDHEVRGREAEQDEHQHLALPAREQVLEHGDRALPGVAAPGHLGVDRQRAEQRDEDEDDGGDRRHRARREERDARLVAEGREVVDAGQPDDLPPGMRRQLVAGVVVHRLAAPQPPPEGGAVLERRLGQPLAEGDALRGRGPGEGALGRLGLGCRCEVVRHSRATPR